MAKHPPLACPILRRFTLVKMRTIRFIIIIPALNFSDASTSLCDQIDISLRREVN